VLDHVFVSTDWEVMFSLYTLVIHPLILSDHSPLVLSSGEDHKRRDPLFFFEKGWLERSKFVDMVTAKWRELEKLGDDFIDPIDVWNHILAGLHQFFKGWGVNLGRAD
jgi:hypothetical protein